MARSNYIYTVTIHNTILWVGTVKREMREFLQTQERYDIDWLWVQRRENGSQLNKNLPNTQAQTFLNTDTIV